MVSPRRIPWGVAMPSRHSVVVGVAGLGFVVSIVFVTSWPAAAQNESQRRKLGTFAGTRAGQVRDDNSLTTKLVWIPPGEFTMGSPKGEKGHNLAEDQVQVRLSRG